MAEAGFTGAVTGIALEEARSSLATLIGQIMAIFRTLITYALSISRMLFNFISTHPEATLQLVGVMYIWMT